MNDDRLSDDEYNDLVDKFYEDLEGDVYPQPDNNQLTNTSTPRAFLYNKNTDGRKLLNISITDITQNEDGTMSFHFAPDNSGSGEEGDNTDTGNGGGGTVIDLPEGVLFYESFDQCDGTGGNDNSWNGQVAASEFEPDNDGWVAEKAYGAYKCARFGNTSTAGSVTTPSFTVNGEADLSFYAGAWDGSKDGTKLNISVTGGTISASSQTIKKGAFSICKLKLQGNGNMKVTFSIEKGRFFLDEVIVSEPVSGIDNLRQTASESGAYDLCGRLVNTQNLGKGLYLMNGKKMVVR